MMRAFVSLAVLVTFVVCVYSQCTPPQFEANRVALSNVNQITRKLSPVHVDKAKISYDETNERLAISFEVDTVNHKPQKFKILDIYQGKSGIRYAIQESDGTCLTQHLNNAFPKLCVGAAKFERESYVGLESDGFLVSEYILYHNGIVASAVIRKDDDGSAIPVAETTAAYIDGEAVIETQRYSDFKRGISDESAFDVPPQCGSQYGRAYLMSLLKYKRDHAFFKA